MIRIELSPENEKRVNDALNRIQKETGLSISYTRFINIFLAAIDSVEFQSEAIITLKQQTPEPDNHQITKLPPRKIKRTSSWMSGL